MKKTISTIIYFLIKSIPVLLFVFSSATIRSQDSLNCTKIGEWTNGPCFTVEANDNYAFINDGDYLEILDVSDSSNFVLITKYLSRGFIYDIKIRDTLVYLAINGIGLSVVNVADINNPVEEGFLQLYGYFPKIEINSERLYYSSYDLFIIDISNPKSLRLIKKYNTDWTFSKINIKDDYLYIAAGWSGFKIFDISYPDTLNEIYTLDNIYGYDIDIKDSYACFVTGDSIMILDISTPSDPVQISAITLKYISTCRFYKNMIIAAGYHLYSVDISDPAKPELLYNYYLHSYTRDLCLLENRIYTANESNGFYLCKINNEGKFSLFGKQFTSGLSVSVAVKDNIAYLSQGYNGLQIIDISNLSTPVYLKSLDLPKQVKSIKVIGDYLFCSYSGLKIYDISDPKNPVEVSYLDIGVPTFKFKIVENTLYLASGKNGVTLIDISDIYNLTKISEIDTPGFTIGVDVKENRAYAADNDGLHIIDITDPENPFEIKYFDGQKKLKSVKIIENYAYIGSTNYGLRILDISNIDSISVVKYTNTGRGHSLFIKDSIAYVSAGFNGLIIFNITDIANPVEIGYYDTPGRVNDLVLSDNHIFLADYDSGMSIIDFDICATLNINYKLQDISCNGQCDGNIRITGIENATNPIQYNWNTGQTGSYIEGLCQGTYVVTITDNNNCEITDSFYITEPDSLYIKTLVKLDITDSNSKGYIGANISGGTPEYTYEWSGPNGFSASTQNITELEAGCYTLTVTDTGGCTLISDDICIEDKRTGTYDAEFSSDIHIYPNPAKNVINISCSDTEILNGIKKIEIFDSAGIKVKEAKTMKKIIGIQDLKSGFYIIQLTGKEQKIIKKMIVLK